MVDRQERERMGEIPEWEGTDREEGRQSWCQRECVRADTPQPDDGRLVRNKRGNSMGVMRSGSGKSSESAARKEVRWSKDVDYEG